MSARICRGLVLNVPEIFADSRFQEWLNNDERKFTWHRGGPVDEWSDVIVLIDPSLTGEGSDSDMPAEIWNRIVDECRRVFSPELSPAHHYMVRLTNLER
ncbi:hypothetical protein PX699_16880 [Sphingobium sp. H39-3-25]|uniref:hypothetical protein n=1 Tax=Sphingomonadales TaxID=204457 RepID=UPI000836AE84|nr:MULTISPECIES: hypothetical protein [Sphingomonadaceae]MDF0491479.1 hypothetical protein [Sphingomonas pollutisoli]MDF0544029.1 hypothetical protein [Sphingobium arseniciresistens]